ncbi:RING/U-box superfamily protein [Striga hermonthica]|uniref:RING/U-box superfamily protein n=1 Tax=Striga hermonthica TaxID=68872 RepID=A0A9N7NDV4_STRHE|nr:RING/U-box superfamily protein [Striga hermonthica]
MSDSVIGSEKFDSRVGSNERGFSLLILTQERLVDYWMTKEEMKYLNNEAYEYAQELADLPQHASLNPITIAVDLKVFTVQQQGEKLDECLERAITSEKMIPLYVWPFHTCVGEVKPMTALLLLFLNNLKRVRVENSDQGLSLMEKCGVCSKGAKVGDQVSLLVCKHAFHSRCAVLWLEDCRFCPCCDYPAYAWYVDQGPPFYRHK